jgi:hypothetical protein
MSPPSFKETTMEQTTNPARHRFNTEIDHWRSFQTASMYYLDKVLDRDEVGLPSSVIPAARGVAIASENAICRAHNLLGDTRPHDWKTWRTGARKRLGRHTLQVQQCGDFWMVERQRRRGPCRHEILVHNFGSTPILTKTREEAMLLGEFAIRAEASNTGPYTFRFVPVDA